MFADMNERKLAILKAVVSDYVATGEPVGSRTLAKKYELGISPATIRNEMADLEDMGYLESPHTSAGRVPSSKGYRVYVDQLMDRELDVREQFSRLEHQILSMASYQIEQIIRQTSQMLSEMTNLAIITSKPSTESCRIKTLQLVSLDQRHIMVVLVLDNNQIKNTILETEDIPPAEDLLTLSNLLTAQLTGRSAQEIDLPVMNAIRQKLGSHAQLFSSIMASVHDAVCQNEDPYIVEGKNNVLDYPEFNEIAKAKEILEVLDKPDDLMDHINEGYETPYRIVIGEEINLPETKDMSIISAKYQLNGKDVGTINLLGPKRLNYSKMTTILKTVVTELNEKLATMTQEADDG